MKLGIIGTCYNMGISHIAWGFAEHFDSKTLLYHYKPFHPFPERFENSKMVTKMPTDEDLDWLLDGIDCLLTIETPYNWSVYKKAKEKGVKTILMPMFEWLNRSNPALKYVDLFICPSKTTYEKIEGNKIEVPSEVPIDLKKFKPRKVKKAKTFLHNAGHGGMFGRNATKELVEAFCNVKSNIKLLVNTQNPLNKVIHPKIEYREKNYRNYWEMYGEGDVYILLGKYGVAYLGIQEAMAAGMPIAFTDMEPFNTYLPKEMLIKPGVVNQGTIYAGQKEAVAEFDTAHITERIDEIAQMDLRPFQKRSLELAKERSWDVWQPKYLKIFEDLCENSGKKT